MQNIDKNAQTLEDKQRSCETFENDAKLWFIIC